MFWTVAFLSQYPESVLAKSEVECGYGERQGIGGTLETKAQGKKDGLAISHSSYVPSLLCPFSRGTLSSLFMGNL